MKSEFCVLHSHVWRCLCRDHGFSARTVLECWLARERQHVFDHQDASTSSPACPSSEHDSCVLRGDTTLQSSASSSMVMDVLLVPPGASHFHATAQPRSLTDDCDLESMSCIWVRDAAGAHHDVSPTHLRTPQYDWPYLRDPCDAIDDVRAMQS